MDHRVGGVREAPRKRLSAGLVSLASAAAVGTVGSGGGAAPLPAPAF